MKMQVEVERNDKGVSQEVQDERTKHTNELQYVPQPNRRALLVLSSAHLS
jgi:hypothetical protein